MLLRSVLISFAPTPVAAYRLAKRHAWKDAGRVSPHLSYSLNSLKGGYIGAYIGDYYRGLKGATRSLDYSSLGEVQGGKVWLAALKA